MQVGLLARGQDGLEAAKREIEELGGCAIAIYVGWPTVEAIVANKIAPGLLDRYLGHHGYTSQQTSEPEDPERPNNLWRLVAGDPGAHGAFGEHAKPRSYQVWADLYPGWLRLATILAACGVLALASFRG